MKVKIKLKKKHPYGRMNFGKYKIERNFKTFDLDDEHIKRLETPEAKHWFSVEEVKRTSRSRKSGD